MSFTIKQAAERIVKTASSEKRPTIANVSMKLLIPAIKATLNPIDTTTFSSLHNLGRATATNAYPGTKTKKGTIRSEGAGVLRTKKININTE